MVPKYFEQAYTCLVHCVARQLILVCVHRCAHAFIVVGADTMVQMSYYCPKFIRHFHLIFTEISPIINGNFYHISTAHHFNPK